MRTELEFQWDLVEEEISTLFSNHFDKIKGLLEKMQLVIEGERSAFNFSWASHFIGIFKLC